MGVLAPRFPLPDFHSRTRYPLGRVGSHLTSGCSADRLRLNSSPSPFSSQRCLHSSHPRNWPTSPLRVAARPQDTTQSDGLPTQQFTPTPSPRANVTSASPVHPRAAHPLRCSEDMACVCKSPMYITNVMQCAGGCGFNAATFQKVLAFSVTSRPPQPSHPPRRRRPD
ncbi:hypothetical protein B0H15DRAFT_185020 [Mycena belliarum]|uniref:Uncharacterized protein n=1 Tax=Mycena belliarum TaxID=1033014 RepID=A0AAD6U5U6_9AGAR|nr:hypothetical protein B0H15DRAFT_185020 [Mycena belliae]